MPLPFRTIALAACAALVLPPAAYAQTSERIYIAPDDHTDYMWSANEAFYSSYFPRGLDVYLAQIDRTAARPADEQAKWNADGSLWMWEYERSRTPEQMQRLMDRVRDGHISMPLNTLVSVHGASPLEAVLRDMYYAGRLERRYAVRFPLAIAMENQTASYGLGAVFAGAGARYTWKGVCGCATNVPRSGDREADAYWWTGPDGSRVLTKWMSLHDPLPSAVDRNQGPGGYAETRFPREVIPFVRTSAAFKARWPYDVIGLIGQGWDDATKIVQLTDTQNSFPAVARDLATPGHRVIVSDTLDFFRDFEASHGATLPTQGVSFGNEWEISLASFAEKSARVRRAVEKLRAGEALATLVALNDPTFLDGRATARDAAFRAMGLFFEHNIGGGSFVPALNNDVRAAYQERQAKLIEAYVDTLYADGAARLAQLLPTATTGQRVFVFNPLGFVRSDIADFAVPGSGAFSVIDLRTNQPVPAQAIGTGAERRVRILATNIPSIGYSLYEIRNTAPTGPFADTASFADATLSTANYRLTLNARGAIESLIERTRSDREWVRASNGRLVNDLGEGSGTITLESNGPVSATLRADITGAQPRTVRATLYAGLKRVDLADTIDAGFDDVKTYSFAFDIAAPRVRHEEVGAVVAARIAPDGVYSPRVENSLYQWLTLNHFADMTAGDRRTGITLANSDAYFMRLGNSDNGMLDIATPRIDVLAGGRAYGDRISGIRNQAGDTHFTHRFALLPHGAFDQAAAMRFALGAQNPFVTGNVTGPTRGAALASRSYGLIAFAPAAALAWTVKPAEEGIAAGVIVRMWNQTAVAQPVRFALNQSYRIAAQTRTSSVETDLAPGDPLALPDPNVLKPNQIATFRLNVVRR